MLLVWALLAMSAAQAGHVLATLHMRVGTLLYYCRLPGCVGLLCVCTGASDLD